jgi:hypothetical protein
VNRSIGTLPEGADLSPNIIRDQNLGQIPHFIVIRVSLSNGFQDAGLKSVFSGFSHKLSESRKDRKLQVLVDRAKTSL